MSLEERNRLATAIFHAWYRPLYNFGVIHGDPHLGNYQVRDDNGLNLLDYGAIRVFPAKFVSGVIDLYEAIRDEDMDRAHLGLRAMGFRRPVAGEDGGAQPMGTVHLRASAERPRATDPGARRFQLWPVGGREGPRRAEEAPAGCARRASSS